MLGDQPNSDPSEQGVLSGVANLLAATRWMASGITGLLALEARRAGLAVT